MNREEDADPFLLDSLLNPGILYPLYSYLNVSDFSLREEISEKYLIPIELINEGLRTLQSLGFVEKRREHFRTVDLPYANNLGEIGFKISLIHQLAKKSKGRGGWKKQAAFYLILDYLVTNGPRVFSTDNPTLPTKLDDWFEEKGYAPTSQMGSKIKMNKEKLLNWAKLSDYLQILIGLEAKHYLISINPEIFANIVDCFSKETRREHHSIISFVEWCNENFLPITLKPSNTIPFPFSRLLCELHLSRKLVLENYGDYQIMIFGEVGRQPGLLARYNSFRCL